MSNTETTRKNKTLSPLAVRVIFIIMAIGIIRVYLQLKGNPLTGMKLNKEADRYIQENYPQLSGQFIRTTDAYFIKDKISVWNSDKQEYSVADGTWNIYYSKSSTPDAYIYFVYDRDGNLIYDSCKEKYLKGGMIYKKLSEEYNYYVEKIFNEVYNNSLPKVSFSYAAILEGSFASGWFENNQTIKQAAGMWPASGHTEQYTGPILDINQVYTMEEMADEYGIVLFNYNDEQNAENLYTRCLEVRDIITEYNIPLNKICITLDRDNGLYNIGREQLFSEDLMQYIKDNYTVL